MVRENDYIDNPITDPLIELLAIKLYEHDHRDGWPSKDIGWMFLLNEDREIYRELARGNGRIGHDQKQ